MCCSLNFSGSDDIGSTWTTVVNVHELRILPAKSSHALRELRNVSTKLSKSLFILLVSQQCLQFRNLKYSGSSFEREVLKRPGVVCLGNQLLAFRCPFFGLTSFKNTMPSSTSLLRGELWLVFGINAASGCEVSRNLKHPSSSFENMFSYLFSHVSLGDQIVVSCGIFDRIPFECIMAACLSPDWCLGWSMGCTLFGEGASLIRFLLSYKLLISSSSCACVVRVFL